MSVPPPDGGGVPAFRSRSVRIGVAAALLVLPALLVPRWWCARDADGWYDGDAALQARLAREVCDWVRRGVSEGDFHTGSVLFDGEWVFGTYQMAATGLAQVAREHPELAAEFAPVIDLCVERMTDPSVRAFDARMWHGDDPLEGLDGDEGHAAYLGYLNLALGLQREVSPEYARTDLHDRITAALVRRTAAHPMRLLETYPGQTYPVDNAAVVGSIALHSRLTGTDRGALLRECAAAFRGRCRDEATGLLHQALAPSTGAPVDAPRASGTALAAYFLSFADAALSRELRDAVEARCAEEWAGFRLTREYARGTAGAGDIDSGPVVLGIGFSASGFALAGDRIHGDRDAFRARSRLVHLFGAPWDQGDRRTYACGGPLGNAILLTMLTAPRAP